MFECKKLTAFARLDIERLIPHRHTAQMIDSAVYYAGAPDIIVGTKKVNSDDPWLVGHFPHDPIFPGHCQLECANLVAALLIYMRFPDMQGTPVVAGADGIRWKEPVRPGDILTINVDFVAQRTSLFFCKAKITNQRNEVTARIKEIIGTMM